MEQSEKRILLVEDEPHLAFNIQLNLQQKGYRVDHVADGLAAIKAYTKIDQFDAIILDIMLPHVSGYEVARHIRSIDDKVGILMLTAKASEDDLIKGFDAGTDDYLTKPFKLSELLLRVKRMIQRSNLFIQESSDPRSPSSDQIKAGGISLNPETLELQSNQGTFHLTSLESKVLMEFLNHRGKVLSREYLLEKAWGIKGRIETRTVDNFILRLRRYIESVPEDPKILKSVRGRGYIFQEGELV